jgi:hypothetical protein
MYSTSLQFRRIQIKQQPQGTVGNHQSSPQNIMHFYKAISSTSFGSWEHFS